ncbi:MAG TPA: hypothetical protein VFQ45_02600 [Longimicrobium sp.]|nr:hypothetical protein [Longimicrobium sp.]
MANGKLRLNLAELRLKSFETTAGPSAERGTVRGMDQCGACTYCTACTNSCGAATWCIDSCAGPSNDSGASQTDCCNETGAFTCFETCSETCDYVC